LGGVGNAGISHTTKYKNKQIKEKESTPFSTISAIIPRMSEYIEIEEEETDDINVMIFHTNLPLANGIEKYDSLADMEQGSPVANALAMIEGIATAEFEDTMLTIRREDYYDWYAIAADISAALKDFFL
jgi:hypothetical protein